MINTSDQNHSGQFIFPKNILVEKQLISNRENKGKLGIRVYPPWDLALNPQAKKTQVWQLNYFVAISNSKTDLPRAKSLINNL